MEEDEQNFKYGHKNFFSLLEKAMKKKIKIIRLNYKIKL